ncbi:MAG: nitroreductase family protein [Acidobacteriia bacterium]|nr:nitroreductase family protein [Terriglobia bacterium]
MEFNEVILHRHSIRNFTDQMVEADKLQKILETANLAPSAGNLQAYEIYVVTDPKKKDGLSCAALAQEYIAAASIVLVFCTHPERTEGKYTERGTRLYTVQDATIACTFAMLAATNLSLGSVWVGTLDEKVVRMIIGAPESQVPVVILAIGYPAEFPDKHPRRSLKELAHWVS